METETAVPVPSKNNAPLKTADQVDVPVSELDTFVLRELQPCGPEQERLGDIHYFISLPLRKLKWKFPKGYEWYCCSGNKAKMPAV